MILFETLPGWPEAPELSAGFYIMLLFVLPLATGVVVALLTWAPRLAARARREEEQSSTDLARQ